MTPWSWTLTSRIVRKSISVVWATLWNNGSPTQLIHGMNVGCVAVQPPDLAQSLRMATYVSKFMRQTPSSEMSWIGHLDVSCEWECWSPPSLMSLCIQLFLLHYHLPVSGSSGMGAAALCGMKVGARTWTIHQVDLVMNNCKTCVTGRRESHEGKFLSCVLISPSHKEAKEDPAQCIKIPKTKTKPSNLMDS